MESKEYLGSSSTSSVSSNINPTTIDNVDADDFLHVQDAANIIRAANSELMRLACERRENFSSEQGAWFGSVPTPDSIKDLLPMFQTPPAAGKRVECSIETQVLPIALETLISTFMDVKQWTSAFSSIIHYRSGEAPTGFLKKVYGYTGIKDMKMVRAEFCLPTPFVPARKFHFLRWQKEVLPDQWAIVDLSADYFPKTHSDAVLKTDCRRRSSGIIFRKHGKIGGWSQVMWIENVEVPDLSRRDNIYWKLMDSKLAFCAKHWVDMLLQLLKRYECYVVRYMGLHNGAVPDKLLKFTEAMEAAYLETVCGTPDESKWSILSNTDVRILKGKLENGWHNFVASTSFRLRKKPPQLVIESLASINHEPEEHSLSNPKSPEEELRLANKDNSYSFFLQRIKESEDEPSKNFECKLEEVSRCQFCYFFIGFPMTGEEKSFAFDYKEGIPDFIRPAGFAVMPDGSAGLESNGSLATLAIHRELPPSDEDPEAILSLKHSIMSIVDDIKASI